MPRFTLPRVTLPRTTRKHKIATAVLVAAGASTAVVATVVPSSAQPPASHASAAVKPVSTNGLPAKSTTKDAAKDTKADAKKTDTAKQAAKSKPSTSAADHAKAAAAAKKKHVAKEAANRSTVRKAPVVYKNNLDGWIKQSLAIMKAKGIPGTYEGLHRNIMRESSGNPNAVNNWDINARNGIPSKGLLQVIQPTFDRYHVKGTANKLTDPVANLTAAANYAAHRYGSIDNVNSAY
ncbi:transglycosylase SLT domain-containing protein [Streptomyces sp. NBC_01387]|uniref:transglycosylase SLT domain-containing protein n=1 Tax=unclassified Streptomyces TaxID=2593676 RepID=UPI002023EBA4|nr:MULTISPECIES: transglycosylase SLT domain-containing protein [unclassified Streptomyces]MCX4553343.1 transglycosylase SLT domain-containing protein [Streptomyces sp. NBC_01500]WSC18306.1 transglycosylase SLT domain-containing protein [Streptomyces sp. NBC_01766]WSV52348.1 transglycosylase SLT domain-containing protein [Streptomyces sp. NBC_01014]